MSDLVDVVVVGGGGAGLCAAAAACEAGARVVLLTKTPAGMGNCTAHAGGGFTLGVEGFTPERHRALTWETGRFLSDPRLLDVFSAEAPRRVADLGRYGVRLDLRRGGASVAACAPSPDAGGMGLTLPLVRWLRGHGVEIRERVMVTSLLLDDAGVAGVEYVDLVSGEVATLPARAVVVATGGAGRLYGRTDNPVRTTGDGYALLYRAGLPLTDMEFVQFYPLGFAEEGFPTWFISLEILDYAHLTNSDGQRFLDPQLAAWGISGGRQANLFARDRCAVAVARELEAGREVFLHLEVLTPEQWRDPLPAALRRHYPAGRDPAAGPVRVAPVQHYFAGGVVIGDRGETEVPGLFACGEVAAGVDGANRIGGNSLTNLTVFGFRAGEAAASWAASRSSGATAWRAPAPTGARMAAGAGSAEATGGVPAEGLSAAAGGGVAAPLVLPGRAWDRPFASTREKLSRWAGNPAGLSPAAVKAHLNRVADRLLGPLRSGPGLREALAAGEELAGQLPRMAVRSRRDLLDALETENLVLVGCLVAAAALAREESRGVHFRSDFPAEDPSWQRHVVIRPGVRG